nr:EOG090X015P [Cyclestheria hislopi]
MSDSDLKPTKNRKVNNRTIKNKKGTQQKKEDVLDPTIMPRDEGDGESLSESAADEFDSKTTKSPVKMAVKQDSLEVTCRFHILILVLFTVALGTRFYNLDQPNHIVFDEMHYGRYAALYLKNIFFFDSHPPLGKQLLAFASYLGGFQGDFKFDKIGTAYNSSVPVFAMRAVPAACGSLLIPIVYLVMLQLGYSQWTAALGGFLFLFDNSLLTQSHYMLMESIILFFAMSGLLCILKFRQMERSPNSKKFAYSFQWWGWLLSAGFFFTCTFCVKYVGIYSYGLGLALVGHDFWNKIIGDKTMSKLQLTGHTLARALAFIAVPMVVYIGVFYIHLSTLTHAGPHDSAMSSAFQASLEGGLSSIIRGQPLEVVHGSQITLRHSHGAPCWLHSHADKYPVRYPDKRGSSHQQQVTCYHHKDINNWWIVKRPNRSDLAVAAPLDKIHHGDLIQLVHGITGRTLNTHNVAAPASPTKQEVSCYIDHNVSMPAQDIWRLEITNRDDVGDIWHAIESNVRFIHLNTSAAVAFTGRNLPEWGHNQYEIAADVMVNQPDTLFNVEEHRYTRNDDERDRQLEFINSDFIPLEPTQMTFWEKFFELQLRMLFISNENVQNHMYTSSPWEWLTLTRGIAYWVAPDSNAQIHLLGNILIWYSATVALGIYSALLVFYLLRRRRMCFDIDQEAWEQFQTTGEVLLLGYAFHFLPYFFVEHTLFLHHYLPALAFQLLLTAAVIEHLYYLSKQFIGKNFISWTFIILVLTWMGCVLAVFQRFAPLSYGTGPMNASQILDLKLKDTWDFIIHKH